MIDEPELIMSLGSSPLLYRCLEDFLCIARELERDKALREARRGLQILCSDEWFSECF